MKLREIEVVGAESRLAPRQHVPETQVEIVGRELPLVQAREAVDVIESERFSGPLDGEIVVWCENPRCRLARLTSAAQLLQHRTVILQMHDVAVRYRPL